MGKLSKRKVIHDVGSILAVSKITGVARSTIQAAIGRGELQEYDLAGGSKVVSVSEINVWKLEERKTGRKPKDE